MNNKFWIVVVGGNFSFFTSAGIGANDAANAIGPFAVIYSIYSSQGDLSKNVDMGNDAYWILGMGGIGIACGLFIYGKKITYAIGDQGIYSPSTMC